MQMTRLTPESVKTFSIASRVAWASGSAMQGSGEVYLKDVKSLVCVPGGHDGNSAPVGIQKLSDDEKPEPAALAAAFGSGERLEERCLYRWIDPAPIIVNPQERLGYLHGNFSSFKPLQPHFLLNPVFT